ncbi:hypothetical protein Tco_0711964 [Tanacetum coccineum]
MEVLTPILERRVQDSDVFRYHKHCEELKIINVCFADELFIFACGDVELAQVIMDSLKEFKGSRGKLPVKYLGVPLISLRLLNKDCKILVEKAKNRIEDWINKSLSFAGRLQLCLRSLELFNIAFTTTHIWNIISNKESLWVRWIHVYNLKGRSIWDIPQKNDMSWGWRKFLQLREIVRPYFWVKLGNGKDTSLWFDSWCTVCPLSHFLTVRDITREGFNMLYTVADLEENGDWLWPNSWLQKAPTLATVPAPNLEFSVKCAWEAIRFRGMISVKRVL